MRVSVVRLSLIGMALALSGCLTNGTVDLIATDARFEAADAKGVAPAPAFRAGDVFRYKVGAKEVAETVERIDGDGVWWRDDTGRRWIGNDSALIPTHVVVQSGDKPQIIKANIEATDNVFPLSVGKTVAFRSTSYRWLKAPTVDEQSCTVQSFGSLQIAAGEFEIFRLSCVANGEARFNYYAPSLGRVVLQTTGTIFGSVQRELIAFERGDSAPVQSAAMPMDKAMIKDAKIKPAGLGESAKPRFGVQLAAYRSSNRVKKAWHWIKRRGGPLLADTTPHFERTEKASGPLYRLVVGEFTTKTAARRHCQALKRKGVDCWPRARDTIVMPGPIAAGAPANKVRVVSR